MNFLVYETNNFKIEHCYSCSIPGYLIASPKMPVSSIYNLSSECLHELGPFLSQATFAIQEVVNPIKIYCAQFGEENQELHFHLFPRTTELTNCYLSHFPNQSSLIHGPLLLDWARAEFKATTQEVWDKTKSVINLLKCQLDET